ncbi:hypothetical protein AUTU_17700 [Aureibacter tunicatorum]|nr:hypothetical protein AUTU_17700 [Aureibacter tunicatorum]
MLNYTRNLSFIRKIRVNRKSLINLLTRCLCNKVINSLKITKKLKPLTNSYVQIIKITKFKAYEFDCIRNTRNDRWSCNVALEGRS